MRYEGRTYYVGLLKAAELHGATHHAVMEFQIVTDRQLPKIRAGRSYIVFYFRKEMEAVLPAVERRKTDTGSMAVSSVELTGLDLVHYGHAAGGFDAVATVLADLGDKIDGEKLAAIAAHFERASVQRLGYPRDHLEYASAAEPLHGQLFAQSAVPWVKLDPAGARTSSCPRTAIPPREIRAGASRRSTCRRSTNDSSAEHHRLVATGRSSRRRTG